MHERNDVNNPKVTLSSSYKGTFNLAEYNKTATTKAVNVDASAVNNGYRTADNLNEIYGDDRPNVIWSTPAACVMPGKGNDIIYLKRNTNNDDVGDELAYFEGDGDDTIYNLLNNSFKTNGEFNIYLDFGVPNPGSDKGNVDFKNVTLYGDDVIINLSTGNKLTLKGAKDTNIFIRDYDISGRKYKDYAATFGKVTISGNSISLKSDYVGEFHLSNYSGNLSNIDASALDYVHIYGNDKANIIKAGSGHNVIYAGKGNDTVYLHENADYNSINYAAGDGSDTIYSIGSNTSIYFDSCSVKSEVVSGNDVILNIDSGGKLTLKNAVGKSLSISGLGTKTYSNNSDGFVLIPNRAANLVLGTESFDAGNSSLVSDESLGDSVIGVNTTNNFFISSSSIPSNNQLNISGANKNNNIL